MPCVQYVLKKNMLSTTFKPEDSVEIIQYRVFRSLPTARAGLQLAASPVCWIEVCNLTSYKYRGDGQVSTQIHSPLLRWHTAASILQTPW